MSAHMIPPVTVDTITYAEDGSNGDEVMRWAVKTLRAYDCERYAFDGAIMGYKGAIKYTEPFTIRPGQTVAYHPDGTLAVHDADEVAGWGTSVEDRRPWWPGSGGVIWQHRTVTTFPDGSGYESAWVEES